MVMAGQYLFNQEEQIMVRQKQIAVATMLLAAATLSFSAEKSYSFKGKWEKSKDYDGKHEIQQGDTVEHGTFNGKPLYWRTKFWTQGDEPGMFGKNGGTNPWVLINSAAYDPQNPSSKYEWIGWNGQLENSLQAGEAKVSTWRNGAEGAYTIIHDDIGTMKWEDHVLPGLEVNRKYPKIKVSWGVYTSEADELEWEQMRTMTLEGHEMTSHSVNHTSAAEQWQWALQDSIVPWTDPSIPESIRGLKVVGFPMPEYVEKNFTGSTSLENDLVKVTFERGWGGGIKDPDAFLAGMEIKVEPKSGVEEITLPTGQKQYVKYTDNGQLNDQGRREGFIASVHAGWYEKKDSPASWAENGGMSWFMLKMFCVDKWYDADYGIQIGESKRIIDEKVYEPLDGKLGQYFPPNKRTEYFCYPYDAYSEVTHDSIEVYDYVTARGGAKSGLPMTGDFFHPYRLDFDAFYMVDPEHKTMFPKNKHSMLTLQGMVDDIIESKGYMIRELHAVCSVPYEQVNDNSVGGWWGGITASLYDDHLKYCTDKIDSNELVTYNASEVIKYRLTGNAVTGAELTKNSDKEYSVNVTATDIKDKYKDEISVIVKFDRGTDEIDIEYKSEDPVWGNHPYRLPRKLNSDGTAWSINVNPYLGEAKIFLDTPWKGEVVAANPQTLKSMSVKRAAYMGIEQGSMKLSLPKGEHKVDLYTASGRLVRRFSTSSTGLDLPVSLYTGNLAKGVLILNVKSQSGNSLLKRQILVK